MPAIERVKVRRPLRFRKDFVPRLVADNIVWRVHRDGFISFPEFGEKNNRPKIPVEALAYIRPMFAMQGMEFYVTPEIPFSTKPNLVPHIDADGNHVFFRLDARWLYLTRAGFSDLLNQLQLLCPRAYRDLARLRPVPEKKR